MCLLDIFLTQVIKVVCESTLRTGTRSLHVIGCVGSAVTTCGLSVMDTILAEVDAYKHTHLPLK